MLSKEVLTVVIQDRGSCQRVVRGCTSDCLYSCEISTDLVEELSSYRDIFEYRYKSAISLFISRYGETALFEVLL